MKLPNPFEWLQPDPTIERINQLLEQKPDDRTEDDWLYGDDDRPRWLPDDDTSGAEADD